MNLALPLIAAVGWVKRLRATQQRAVRSTAYFGRFARIVLFGRPALRTCLTQPTANRPTGRIGARP